MADTSGTLKSIERLKREKRNAKTRLIRERNKLYELLTTTKASKNTIRRYISKIKSEFLRERSLSMCNGGGGGGGGYFIKFEKWFMPTHPFKKLLGTPSNNRKIISCPSWNF